MEKNRLRGPEEAIPGGSRANQSGRSGEIRRDLLKKPVELQRAGALRLALFLLGAGLTVHGIFNGSMRDVLIKAIMICAECVGLG